MLPGEELPEEKGMPKGFMQRFTEWVLSFFQAKVLKSVEDTYLEEGEAIIDYLPETLVPAFDFRWLILTDRRVILAVRSLLDEDFRDMTFEGLEFEYKKGAIMFDEVRFERFSNVYRSQFYSFYRPHLIRFLNQLEGEMKARQMPSEEEKDERAIHTLKDLSDLLDKGIITEEEFEKRKQDLIDEIKD